VRRNGSREGEPDSGSRSSAKKRKREKEKGEEERGRGGKTARLGWFGGFWAGPVPGSAQWLPFSFFCSGSFSFPIFLISFLEFA
jgi:hypothetical protein